MLPGMLEGFAFPSTVQHGGSSAENAERVALQSCETSCRDSVLASLPRSCGCCCSSSSLFPFCCHSIFVCSSSSCEPWAVQVAALQASLPTPTKFKPSCTTLV